MKFPVFWIVTAHHFMAALLPVYHVKWCHIPEDSDLHDQNIFEPVSLSNGTQVITSSLECC
jgi:hypothetical protein